MIKNFVSIFRDSITKKAFTLKGRSGNKEYLIFTVFQFLVFIPLLIIEKKYGRTSVLDTIAIISVIIYLIPYTSLTIRRLHDCGLKGYWYILNFIFSPAVFLMFCFIKGTPTTNKYGEPPND